MLFTYLRITDYSFASLCVMYVWLNLLRRVLRLKWLHALMFPLLNTASRPLSTCLRSNYFDFIFPCIRFRFPDRALPFPYPFPHKNMKTKVVRVFSRSFPTAFIPTKDVNKKHEVHLSGVHCKELHRCLASISVFLANSVIFNMLAQCTACLVKCEATGYIEAITSPLSVSLLLQTFCL